MNKPQQPGDPFDLLIMRIRMVIALLLVAIVFMLWYLFDAQSVHEALSGTSTRAVHGTTQQDTINTADSMAGFWKPADIQAIEDSNQKKMLEYGKDLISRTSVYFGPHGQLAHSTNGMNCNNCHLEAGTKPWGNNYGSVFSTYPKYRARSGQVEDIVKRVNDCFERSLNGEAIPADGHEMKAIRAYLEYIGKDVVKGEKANASGIFDLPFLSRAADPESGRKVYVEKCQSCHQAQGQGVLAADGIQYSYPPLWGEHSYNTGAGLFRLSRLAGYIKYNMPLGTTYPNALLRDEQAWDVAAYINSRPRPRKDLSRDWPKMAEKPVDHPFGPYADPFSEAQHKYGPWKAIADYRKSRQGS